MILSMPWRELVDYTSAQINNLYPDGKRGLSDKGDKKAFMTCLDRVDECFKHITLRGYASEGEACFSHLHSDQYAQYIYILSNQLWLDGRDENTCRKLLNLNRALNGIFVSYKLSLPPHFLFGHPLGTILGNATYGDGLVVYQGVTINSGKDGTGSYVPVIGKGCFFAAGAKVIGDKPIGDRVSVGVDAVVYKQSVPSDSLVISRGRGSEIIRRTQGNCFAQQFFDVKL